MEISEFQFFIQTVIFAFSITDALDLDSSMPITMTATPHKRINVANPTSDMSNFAKSLPIEIANSPLTNGRSYLALESDEDVSI